MTVAIFPGHTTEVPVVERPTVNQGDVFEYADRFETIDCKRWVVEGRGAGGVLTTRCKGNVAYFADDGALLRIVGDDGHERVKFTPKASAIPFPLTVGARWTAKFKVSTDADLAEPAITESCVAVAYEKINIAAGEMLAIRVNCTDNWHVAFLSGTSTSTLWYAPDAKAIVKAVSSGDAKWNLELAAYTFK